MNTNDANHNPSFTPQRKFYSLPPVLRPLPKDGATLSPKNRIFLSKRKKPFCNQFRIVVSFLLFFVLLSFVMTILFLWQVHLRSKGQAAASPKKNLVEDPASSCIPLPKPIPLAKLSERLNDKLQEMEKFIVKNMAVNKGFGALSANLVYRDKIIWRGTFGVMNKSEITPRKPSTASVYPCASISKVITALIAYKLLDENMITSLDEPVTKYDPDFKIKNPFNNHNITLRNLLSMTSGIQREAPCFTTKKNNFCPFDHNTMLKRIQNLSLLVEPNTILQYSNFGYALLGNVLAKRFTSGDFGALAKKYVLEPLGMDSTKFSINLSQLKHVPVAYVEDGKPAKVYDWGWLNPGGGMFTTVDDLAKMVKELLTDRNQGRYLSKYTTRELLSVVMQIRSDQWLTLLRSVRNYAGLSFIIFCFCLFTASVMPDGKTMAGTPWEMELVDGIVYREKGGSVFGYEGRVVMVPELRIALNVLCTNCFGFISNLISTSFVKQIVPSLEQELRKHQD
ncbi:hypothetical protein QZH41_015247, partial [Actinostola sp. cb2023]